ncbi:MAG: PKD domain-containing protein, partial [Bacteroidetes bacterium]|nr:PKD domain-containing protein [Bacteroidota bacterium]
IPAGIYSVTITDSKYCTYIQTFNVSQPTEILLSTDSVEATCSSSNGQASVSPSGGTFPYTYLWSPGGGTSQTIINLLSAAYTVTVTDASGCTQTSVVLVTNAAGPVVTISSIQNVSCFGGNNGQASVTVTGGLAPYTYSWSPYGGSSDTASGLGSGTYIVTVTDANGCQGLAVTNPEITQPPSISVTTQQVNVFCTGAANGSASLTVTGGTPGYSYFWSPTGLTTPNVSGLSPGIHNVTVTDANGCEEYSFIDITEPLPLSASITTTHNISCYGGSDGSATCIVSGGTLPMSYNWSPSGAASQTATGLAAGTHTVYVTDANGCNGSATVFLSQPSPLSISTGHTDVSCYNGSDAMAWVLYAGGTPQYSFSWSPSGGNNDTSLNLSAGTYFITVTDNNACQQYSPLTISQPVAVNAEIANFENVNCSGGNDGYTTVSVTGGTPGYTYHWSNNSSSPTITGLIPGTYYVTVTDSRGCSDSTNVSISEPATPLELTIASQNVSCNSFSNGTATANVSGGTPPYTYVWVPAGQVTQTAQNLLAGNYTVSVTDSNGCQISGNVEISQPQPLSLVLQIVQPVVCNSTNTGIASVTVQGGTPPYSYTWNTIPVQTTAIAQSIYAGPLTVTVTDQMGCTIISSSYMPEPTAISAFIVSHSDVSCHNGANGIATAAASGGTPPYSYLWNTVPSQNLQTATNLSPGSYLVTVTDANGCQSTTNVSITNPTQVITTAMGTGTLCLGDSTTISATGSGGAGNYFFNWNMGLGIGSTHVVSPLIETSYIVTAYDQNGCPGIPDTVIVSVLSLFPQNVTMYANSPICPGTSSLLYVTAIANSYDTLYYSWSNGLGPGPGAFVVIPLQETTYYVTITNSCNFTVIDSIRINFKPLPDIYFIPDANQGCAPVTINFDDNSSTLYDEIVYWQWNFGDNTSSNQQNTEHTYYNPGIYYMYLTVETSGGCINSSASSPLTINVFENPTASFSINSSTLYLPNDPLICTNTSSGAVAYWWNFGDGYTSAVENPVHNYSNLGSYSVVLIATNLYNCTDTAKMDVA